VRIKYLKISPIAMWFIASALAFGQHMNAKDAPCQGPSITVLEADCFAASLKKSDLQLNRLYQRIQAVVHGDEQIELKGAQQFWIQFRDSNCLAEQKLYEGGSATSAVRLACLEAMTRHRTEELQVMYGWRLEKFEK
jgi:uncharacterized protein YecT (DUF1311 family)